jgi:hypothetical protein
MGIFRRPLHHWLLVTLCGLVLALAPSTANGGGVRRRITIRSNPPGALVYIDDQEIGITPVSTSFVYYGTRKIQLLRDGFETLTVLQRFRAPWYQIPPLDFASENLWPGKIRDERVLEFQLLPLRNVPNQEVRSRGEDLRQRARQGWMTPMPGFHGGVAPGSNFPSQPGNSEGPGTTLPPGGWILPSNEPPTTAEPIPSGLPRPNAPPLPAPGLPAAGGGPYAPPAQFPASGPFAPSGTLPQPGPNGPPVPFAVPGLGPAPGGPR